MYENKVMLRLIKLVEYKKIVLFMKGEKAFPMCGNSGKICHIFKQRMVQFDCVNLLREPELTAYFKQRYPEFIPPYLFVNTRLVGGYHEIMEFLQSNKL